MLACWLGCPLLVGAVGLLHVEAFRAAVVVPEVRAVQPHCACCLSLARLSFSTVCIRMPLHLFCMSHNALSAYTMTPIDSLLVLACYGLIAVVC